jgi:hypothetical protein
MAHRRLLLSRIIEISSPTLDTAFVNGDVRCFLRPLFLRPLSTQGPLIDSRLAARQNLQECHFRYIDWHGDNARAVVDAGQVALLLGGFSPVMVYGPEPDAQRHRLLRDGAWC